MIILSSKLKYQHFLKRKFATLCAEAANMDNQVESFLLDGFLYQVPAPKKDNSTDNGTDDLTVPL